MLPLEINFNQKTYSANLDEPIDLSIPLVNTYPQVNCFNAPLFQTKPVKAGNFIGSTSHGSPVNFYDVLLNPHGNGTHTECVGHISKEINYINHIKLPQFQVAQLISVFPQLESNGDRIITAFHLEQLWDYEGEKALIIRTLPNDQGKLTRNYSQTNPPYFTVDAIELIVSKGIEHLLTDLPSIDREEDDGKIEGHKAFWQFPDYQNRQNCTITELIFVPDITYDGIYLLNLQIINLSLDATPSRPILFKLN